MPEDATGVVYDSDKNILKDIFKKSIVLLIQDKKLKAEAILQKYFELLLYSSIRRKR